MSRRWNRVVVALALLVILAAPAAAWPWRSEEQVGRGERPLYTRIVEALEDLWSGLTVVWEQEGLAGDPNGTPQGQEGPTTQGDEGLAGDPNG